jgi:uncharacterized BrkB/YihY/UPF0761 family membrane protein
MKVSKLFEKETLNKWAKYVILSIAGAAAVVFAIAVVFGTSNRKAMEANYAIIDDVTSSQTAIDAAKADNVNRNAKVPTYSVTIGVTTLVFIIVSIPSIFMIQKGS